MKYFLHAYQDVDLETVEVERTKEGRKGTSRLMDFEDDGNGVEFTSKDMTGKVIRTFRLDYAELIDVENAIRIMRDCGDSIPATTIVKGAPVK